MTQRQITNYKSNNLLNDNEFATPTYDEHAALIKKINDEFTGVHKNLHRLEGRW
jgi:hypothetical protein